MTKRNTEIADEIKKIKGPKRLHSIIPPQNPPKPRERPRRINGKEKV